MGLSTGIMLGTYGVMRAQAAHKLGLVADGPPSAARTATAARRVPADARLQSWYTPCYGEGAWPGVRSMPSPPNAADAPPPTPTAKSGHASQGFIPPLPDPITLVRERWQRKG